MSRDESIIYSTVGGSTVPKEILDAMGVFQMKQSKGTIDVWWLYDDGGKCVNCFRSVFNLIFMLILFCYTHVSVP